MCVCVFVFIRDDNRSQIHAINCNAMQDKQIHLQAHNICIQASAMQFCVCYL